MRLHRLRLLNFRQHMDTEIVFGPGVTGIVGPNGSGKTTLLEAIAWAIYGAQAARGDKESVRNLRAKPRSSVRVELDLGLGAHEYRVVRGLHDAELHQDGVLVANALKTVTEKLERTLGMTHEEFFNTYFTGQKELAVMSALKPVERRKFLARVLGYERLELAQIRARERRNALAAELQGLEAGLPDPAELAAQRKAAEQRLAAARRAAQEADRGRKAAQEAVAKEAPHWKAWEARRDRTLSLDGERRMAQQAVVVARQEFQRLDKELADALAAREQLRRLAPELEPVRALQQEREALEQLQREETARREEQAKLDELRRAIGALERRLAELGEPGDRLSPAQREIAATERRLAVAEATLEAERTAWVRDRQDAETKRAQLREQYKDVKQQRDLIVELGPKGECPTCRRPLGGEYEAVLGILDRQLEDITINGNFFKQRAQQLSETPATLREAEQARDAVQAELAQASKRVGELRAQAEERARAQAELEGARSRAAELERRVEARHTGYDAGRHDAVRAELTRLEPVQLEAKALETRAERAEALVKEAELAERALTTREQQVKSLAEAIAAEGFSEEQFARAKERHDGAQLALQESQLKVVEARGDLVRAEDDVREAERRAAERAAREREIARLKGQHRLHNELDRAFSDLRADLNATMRPEIAELASGFLADLTDGRYDEVDLNEDYEVTVLEDGVPKPVISGGEEDIANLVLRLAISQMIAERAGQPLSLLVLDEIFGSLDESHRQHVLALLRRLGDRFPQVVLITHIEQVREGLDRVIRVEYDVGRGTSVVRDDTATLSAGEGGAGAGVAA
jgi:DNA repair protein SbcC/Rad50